MNRPLLACLLLCLSTITGYGQSDSAAWSVDLTDVVVTAQYAPTDARNAVHKVTVLTREEWREQGLNDLSELLQRQLTMAVTPDPILGNGLSIQGLGGQNIQVMIDGVPVIGRLGGNVDLSQLNLARFARVEVIAGALSAQYGSDAAGGVVNLITAKEQANAWKLEAGGQYETIDLDRQYVRIGRQLGDFQLDGGVDHYAARFGPADSIRAGVVPWNPKQQLGYDLNLRYRPHDSLRISYGFRGFDETLSLLGEVRRPQFRPYVQDQLFDTRRQDHSLTAEYALPAGYTIALTTGHNAFDRYKTTQRWDLEPDTTSLVLGGQNTTRYTGQLVRLTVSGAESPTGRLSGQLGLEFRRETGFGGRILDTASLDREPAISNVAAFLSLRYRLTKTLTAEGTARYGNNSRYEHPFVPAVHLLWRPTPSWRWRAGYAAGFRAPGIQELFFNFFDTNHSIIGSQTLLAERSNNLRLRGEWAGRRLPLTITGEAFFNRIRDRITLADADDGGILLTYTNLDAYETHGATLQVAWTPNDKLIIVSGGALTRLLNPTTEADAPRFLTLGEWRNEATFNLPKAGLNFRLDHRYVGRRDRYQLTEEGTTIRGFIGDYHLLHLSANKRFYEDRIMLSTGVKNLLNRDRIPVTGGGSGGAHSGGGGERLIDFGRNFFLGITVTM